MPGAIKSIMSFFVNSENRQINDAALRKPNNDLPPVEQLEQRLCLGSMHAGTADLVARPANDIFESSEIRLQKAPAAPSQYASQTGPLAGNDNRQGVVQHETGTQPRARFQHPAESAQVRLGNAGSPRLVGQHLLSPQTAPALSTAIDSNMTRIIGDLTAPTDEIARLNWQAATNATKAVSTVLQNSPMQNRDVRPDISQSGPAIDEVNLGHHTVSRRAHLDTSALASLGLELDEQGNAIGFSMSEVAQQSSFDAWWIAAERPVVIQYDFRDINGQANEITEQQQQLAVQALDTWSEATGRKIVFEHSTTAPESRIITIGVGDLAAVGHVSGEGAVLGLGGGQVFVDGDGFSTNGIAWLDHAETWDNIVGNGDPTGTVDFSTVVAHELGHTLGLDDRYGSDNSIMNGTYSGERSLETIQIAIAQGDYYRTLVDADAGSVVEVKPMMTGYPQLDETEVKQLLERGAAASASNDAIIAVVDRNGRILGVRVEADALAAIPDTDTLVFAIDGAVAKARTAAMFSNGDPANGTLAPLTSRTIQFVSQSTITQREVESNPNVDNGSPAEALASTVRGPGFVAPVGVGGHFPPGINFTPLVDLFGIEHTNRDSTLLPGADGIKGTADDITVAERFNIDPAFIPAGQELTAPESYGALQNSGKLPSAQSRGIATLPGGIPLFRDTDGNGGGETLVGGIGVFFPGTDGYASHEQGFISGIGQTATERMNASQVSEAEYIAYAAAGGSLAAEQQGIAGAKIGDLNGVAPVAGLDLPFGRLDLVGIQLDVYGPMGSRLGLQMLLAEGQTLGAGDPDSGADQVVDGSTDALYREGESVPQGWLVTPHDSADGSITAAEVERIIENGITGAENVRAAVRLPVSSATRMTFAVTDTDGEVLGLYRMQDATTFSIDVAVAKARNVAYFADANDLQAIDQLGEAGTAYTNRTFRFLSQPRFPSGINGTEPAPYSILFDGDMDPLTGENLGAPAPVAAFTDTQRVYGFDSFFPNTNFRDPGDGVNPAGSPDAYHMGVDSIANQNGVVFFPGSTPLYRDGKLIGGFGVSGDGVDQDDVVTYIGATGFLPEANGVIRADQTFVRNIRLPYQKFLRNPFGGLC